MDFSMIAQAVSTLGFPIAAYAGLFWYMSKEEARHDEESAKFRDVLSQNTKELALLQELVTKLDRRLNDEYGG